MRRLRLSSYRELLGVAIAPIFTLILCDISSGVSLRPDEFRIDAVRTIIDHVYADSFEAAYNSVEAINDTLPGKPLYNLVTASVLHAEMTDLEDYSRKKEFFRLLDSSREFFGDWIDRNPGDPWGYYFLGMVHAYKSMWHAQHKSWLKTMLEGLKARGRFSRTLELDPSLYDAYAGLGNYHFWSSAILRKYLPFIKDNRDQGLGELRLAADSSYFSSKPAATGLAWALINVGRYKDASEIALRLYKRSSGGRLSLWILGSAYWKWGRVKNAGIYYGELIESLNNLEEQNYYNLIFCRYRRGVCNFMTGRLHAAREDFSILLSYPAPEKIRDRHKKTYEKSKEYLEKIERRLNRRR